MQTSFQFFPLSWKAGCFCKTEFHMVSCCLFSWVQSLSRVWLFATPWTAARQASLSITNSRSLPKPMSVELVMPSNYLLLCHPLLLPPSIFPSIRVFSNESALHIRWPKFWIFSFNNLSSKCNPQTTCLVCVCVCSVAKLCLTLCDPMDCSIPGFPVLHSFLEFTQTHVHWLSQWCYLIILFSAAPFSFCPQSFPASESFPMIPISHSHLGKVEGIILSWNKVEE